MDNRFRPIINIGRGATEKNISFVVYLHKSKMAAVGHPEFSTFDILALESNVIPLFRLICTRSFHWNGLFYVSRSSRGQKQDSC